MVGPWGGGGQGMVGSRGGVMGDGGGKGWGVGVVGVKG